MPSAPQVFPIWICTVVYISLYSMGFRKVSLINCQSTLHCPTKSQLIALLAFFGFSGNFSQLRRRKFLRDRAIIPTLFFLREIRLVMRRTCMYTYIRVIYTLIGVRRIGPTHRHRGVGQLKRQGRPLQF